MKTTQKQTGSAHVVIIVILVIAVIGLLGFVFWQNFIKQESTASISKTEKSTLKEEAYNKEKAIVETSDIVMKFACNGSGASSVIKDYRTVKSTEQYVGLNGMSIIGEDLTYAVVLHTCGTSGEAAYMKRTNGQWFIVTESASYPPCNPLREEVFPKSMVGKCYSTNESTEPENVY